MNIHALSITTLAALSTMTHADIYTQASDQPSQQSFFSDAVAGQFFSQRMADNFTLNASASANTIRWWGGSQNFNSPDTDNMLSYTVEIYTSDIAGAPDVFNTLHSQTVSASSMSLSAVATGASLFGGGIEYEYTLDLDSTLNLAAGTQYWISVGATLDNGFGDGWVWSGSSQGDLVNATDFFDGGDYTVFDPTFNDLAFSIIPAPSTAVMGLGMLTLGARRRR
ncbi:MAG: PEP-CTERM sorting domain-containing protein [Phycisphaerales bacterium]